MIKLLVADDSALVRKLLGQLFDAEGDFELSFARNGLEVLAQLKSYQPDVVTLDVNMPEMDGLTCLRQIMIERPCPVVMVSSVTSTDAEATLEAMRMGAVDFIPKPTGALSLELPDIAQDLVAKVRAAASVKPRSSSLLHQRVRRNLGAVDTAADRRADARPLEEAAIDSCDGLVLVGTSTGGPPALEALLTALPASFPWPIVIAQHMPVAFTGPLARRLDKLSGLTVLEVDRSLPIERGHVYIGRGDADVIISSRAQQLIVMTAPMDKDYPWHPSTDRLVRSAMRQVPPGKLVGVLMTGMGDDGAKTMTELREAGGCTIAEAEATAVVWGMPGELVRLNGAQWVRPLQEIADLLQSLLA